MKKEIQSILPQVIHLYLSASGPLFLFKSLRGLTSIQIFASKYSSDQLMDFYSKTVKNGEVDELCLYYIILIALSFKSYGEAKQHLQSLSKEKYIWVKELIEIIIYSFKSIQLEPIFVKKKVEIEKVSVQKITSTNQKEEKIYINKPVIQPYNDSVRNVVRDSTTNINLEVNENEN